MRLKKLIEEFDSFKLAIIMRGVQGSGKSTIIKKINELVKADTHSTDSYFVNEKGDYNFDVTKIAEYHGKNLSAFKESIDNKAPIVICDNTNMSPWEYEKYVNHAKTSGYYTIGVTIIPNKEASYYAGRNTHGVPEETIKNKIKQFFKEPEIVDVHENLQDDNPDMLAEKVKALIIKKFRL
jgi:predicted ABC-type ATPase